MKIDRIRSYEVPLGLTLGPYKSAVNTINSLTTTVVAVDTDHGITGWGEVCPYGANYLPALHGAVQPVLEELAAALIGHDPRDLGVIEAEMDRAVNGQNFVKTALDYACWDILGKGAGLPVATLLGGTLTGRLPLIASVPGGMAEMPKALEHYRGKGYRQFSFHVATPTSSDIVTYRDVIRTLAADEKGIMDANRSWSLMFAIETARQLEDLPLALEQPCADIAQCATLRSRIDLPVILDETIVTPGDLLLAWQSGAVDAIAIKIGRCGGLSKAKRICDLADTLGLTYWIKDVIGAEIATAATAHLAHSRSPKHLAGALSGSDIVNREIAETAVYHEAGEMYLSQDVPGLGIEPYPQALGQIASEFLA